MDERIRSIEIERDNYVGQRRALVDAIERAVLAGLPSARIEGAVLPAFSRDQVRQYVASVRLREAVRNILREAGLGDVVDVRVTGIGAPREVRLNLAADPGDPGYDALPGRIREALRNFADLEPIPRHHDDGEQAGDLLLDGEAVRLARLNPAA